MGEGRLIFGGVVSIVAVSVLNISIDDEYLQLSITCGMNQGIVFIVHYQQSRDRREMHKGVERDKERLKLKKQINSEK
jgi:hypothetical protein